MPLAAQRRPWLGHPRFDRAAALLASHDDFLATGADLAGRLAELERLPDRRRRARLVGKLPARFREWQWAMGCHERYEEERVYPALARAAALVPGPLAAGHAEIHAAADAVLARFEPLAAALAGDPDGAADFAAARAALADYRGVLDAHLALEEREVVPRLLALVDDPIDRPSCAR